MFKLDDMSCDLTSNNIILIGFKYKSSFINKCTPQIKIIIIKRHDENNQN